MSEISTNQNPEQLARDRIDRMLMDAGWIVQSKKRIDFSAGLGIAIREYQTSVGPADYVLFVGQKPLGLIEAKKEDDGHRLTVVEDQSVDYATAHLKFFKNTEGLKYIMKVQVCLQGLQIIPIQNRVPAVCFLFIVQKRCWNGPKKKKVSAAVLQIFLSWMKPACAQRKLLPSITWKNHLKEIAPAH